MGGYHLVAGCGRYPRGSSLEDHGWFCRMYSLLTLSSFISSRFRYCPSSTPSRIEHGVDAYLYVSFCEGIAFALPGDSEAFNASRSVVNLGLHDRYR